MEKDIVTNEHIKADLRKTLSLVNPIMRVVFTLILAFLFIGLMPPLNLEDYPEENHIFLYTVQIIDYIIPCLPLIGGIPEVIQYIRIMQIIKHERFHVVRDTLVRAESPYDQLPSRHHNPRYYRLFFSSFGKYNMLCGYNYSWSKLYPMSDKTVYDLASPGDTFYIVTADDKTALMVYSTNYFEYQH